MRIFRPLARAASAPRPLRPFPLALSVGTDICQVSRIRAILDSPRRARFVGRVLTATEIARHADKLDWAACESRPSVAAFVAGRFAAKEAAIKAHTRRKLTFHDVEIEKTEGVHGLGSGPPVARIRDDDDGGGDQAALVSISHDGDYATAVCIAYVD